MELVRVWIITIKYQVKEMIKNRRLSKAISNVAWYYKLMKTKLASKR